MTAVNKNFRVKNGIEVLNGPVVIPNAPTENTHAANKEYVDAIAENVGVGPTGPTGPAGFIAQVSGPTNTGLLWLDTDEPAALPESLVELASGTLSGSVVSIASINQNYKELVLVFKNFVSTNNYISMKINNDGTSSYGASVRYASSFDYFYDYTHIQWYYLYQMAYPNSYLKITFNDYADTTTYKLMDFVGNGQQGDGNDNKWAGIGVVSYENTAAISSLQIYPTIDAVPTTAVFTSGTYTLYGVR